MNCLIATLLLRYHLGGEIRYSAPWHLSWFFAPYNPWGHWYLVWNGYELHFKPQDINLSPFKQLWFTGKIEAKKVKHD